MHDPNFFPVLFDIFKKLKFCCIYRRFHYTRKLFVEYHSKYIRISVYLISSISTIKAFLSLFSIIFNRSRNLILSVDQGLIKHSKLFHTQFKDQGS